MSTRAARAAAQRAPLPFHTASGPPLFTGLCCRSLHHLCRGLAPSSAPGARSSAICRMLPRGLALGLARALELGALCSPASLAAAWRLAAPAAAAYSTGARRAAERGAPLLPQQQPGGNPLGPAAYVFDIDGVLIRGRNVLPAARKAMALVRRAAGARPPAFRPLAALGASCSYSRRRSAELRIMLRRASPAPPPSAAGARRRVARARGVSHKRRRRERGQESAGACDLAGRARAGRPGALRCCRPLQPSHCALATHAVHDCTSWPTLNIGAGTCQSAGAASSCNFSC